MCVGTLDCVSRANTASDIFRFVCKLAVEINRIISREKCHSSRALVNPPHRINEKRAIHAGIPPAIEKRSFSHIAYFFNYIQQRSSSRPAFCIFRRIAKWRTLFAANRPDSAAQRCVKNAIQRENNGIIPAWADSKKRGSNQ